MPLLDISDSLTVAAGSGRADRSAAYGARVRHEAAAALVGHTQAEEYVSTSVAAVVIAGVAVLVSVVALVLGERRARKQSRLDEAMEARARKADQRDEERAQREEIELRSSQQGRPTTDPATREPGPERAYRFRVTNIGRSSISHLHPELVDGTAADVREQSLVVSVFPPVDLAVRAGSWARGEKHAQDFAGVGSPVRVVGGYGNQDGGQDGAEVEHGE
jgi:hypothetical protein